MIDSLVQSTVCSWRTSPRFAGRTAASTVYSATWPPQGMTRSGVASAPPTSAPPTAANACSCSPGTAAHSPNLLPTPTAHDGMSNGSSAPRRQGSHSLLDRLRLLPTPTASSPNDRESLDSWRARQQRQRARGINGNGMGMPLSIAVRLLPTPTASNAKNCTHAGQGGGPSLPHEVLLLPTPRASDTGTTGRAAGAGFRPPLSQKVFPLVRTETLLPTPRATDGTKGSPSQRGSSGDLMLPSAVMNVVATTSKARPRSTGATTRPRSTGGSRSSAARPRTPRKPANTAARSSHRPSSNT